MCVQMVCVCAYMCIFEVMGIGIGVEVLPSQKKMCLNIF